MNNTWVHSLMLLLLLLDTEMHKRSGIRFSAAFRTNVTYFEELFGASLYMCVAFSLSLLLLMMDAHRYPMWVRDDRCTKGTAFLL